MDEVVNKAVTKVMKCDWSRTEKFAIDYFADGERVIFWLKANITLYRKRGV
jgi:hypothetical protein